MIEWNGQFEDVQPMTATQLSSQFEMMVTLAVFMLFLALAVKVPQWQTHTLCGLCFF